MPAVKLLLMPGGPPYAAPAADALPLVENDLALVLFGIFYTAGEELLMRGFFPST